MEWRDETDAEIVRMVASGGDFVVATSSYDGIALARLACGIMLTIIIGCGFPSGALSHTHLPSSALATTQHTLDLHP